MLSVYSLWGGGGVRAAMLSTPTSLTVHWGVFFFLSRMQCEKKGWFWKQISPVFLPILTRARVSVPLYWILTRSSADLEASLSPILTIGVALPCLAWRSTELASHLGPPSSTRATCLLALSSGPPWPTSKTPRKNMPWHRLNTDLTSFRRWLRSAAVNKIAMKNKWKIIMPTPKHQTIPYIPAGRVQK